MKLPVRNTQIGTLQDTFLVSAVVMILVIRLQLWATDYPQLGGGGLHIAHLLWGGAFMVIALGTLLSFVGRSLRLPAAVIGGVGFGFFIDELGKFITEDNDYFFKPAAGVIYVVFIVLYLSTRWMQGRRGFTPRERLVNAMDMLAEAAKRPLDERERRQLIELLDQSEPTDPLRAPARRIAESLPTVPTRAPRLPARAGLALRKRYFQLARTEGFAGAVAVVFAVWAVGSLLQILGLVLDLGFALDGRDAPAVADRLFDRGGDLSFVNVASVASSLTAGALVVLGVLHLREGDRLGAYEWFDRALLVQIFVTQIFAFVESQFASVFGLGLNVLLLVTVRFMARQEHESPAEAVPRYATAVA